MQQKWFAGARYSDHVAMLHAFQAWEEARTGGEYAEQMFCESKNLSLPTLRITWEAKVGVPESMMCRTLHDEISRGRVNDGRILLVETTASLVAKRRFSRGDSVRDTVKLSSWRGRSSRYDHRVAVHGSLS